LFLRCSFLKSRHEDVWVITPYRVAIRKKCLEWGVLGIGALCTNHCHRSKIGFPGERRILTLNKRMMRYNDAESFKAIRETRGRNRMYSRRLKPSLGAERIQRAARGSRR
jgi:hypothetical protein